MRMFVYKQIRNTIYIINKIHRKIPKTRSRLKPTTFESETHRSNRKFRNSPIRNKHLHSKSRTKRHFRPLEEFLDIHTFQDTSIIFPHAITVIRTENVEHTHTHTPWDPKRKKSGLVPAATCMGYRPMCGIHFGKFGRKCDVRYLNLRIRDMCVVIKSCRIFTCRFAQESG